MTAKDRLLRSHEGIITCDTLQSGKVVSFIFSERMGIVRVTHACLSKLCSRWCIELYCFFLCLCELCLLHFYFCLFVRWFSLFSLWRTSSLDTFWATDCFCTKQHRCMHVVVWTIMWPQNNLLWYMYVDMSVEHCSPLHLLAYAE